MGQVAGWQRAAAGATLGEDQKTPKWAERGNGQTGETNRQTGQPNKESDMMEQAQQTASDVASQVKQATADNMAQAKQTVNETLGQAKQVASETLGQAKQAVEESLSEVKGQMQSTFDEQKTQAVGRLDSVAHALRQTSQQLNAQHETTFAQYAQAAATQLENWSGLLQTKNLNELVNEVQDFAHRQPEIFIAGSLAVGLLLGRFLKSSGTRTTRGDNDNDYRYRGNN
jgi:ElaB/YqjD/DUF883 family membrane-anchored ribosome-binding protein